MEERATVRGQPARPCAESTSGLAHTLRDFRPPQRPSRFGLRLVAGYELLEEIGHGGMGVVWKARQVHLDRLVALKMLRASRASRDDLVRFRTEAEAVARLVHPGIVQIHEIGEHDGQPFFSLEYVAGGSLASAIADRRLQMADWKTSARLVEQLARAVQHAHDHGIVHRDLKPANVLLQRSEVGGRRSEVGGPLTSDLCSLTSDLCPKIADFGLAKRLDRDASQTRAGEVIGTPSYMAPEQAEGRKDLGPAADIWSLGAILYECLTGRPPFLAGGLLETLEMVRKDDPPAPRGLSPGVPRDLEVICLKCLKKSPARRYASAQALADDLGRFLDGRPILARPVGLPERALKWARRRPAVATLLAVSLVVVAAVALAVPWHIYRLGVRVQQVSADMRRALRDSCESRLDEGKAHLARGKLEDVELAIARFAAVQEGIADEDPDPELRGLRDEADCQRQLAFRKLERLLESGPAREKARKFLTLRDEAFFQLYHDFLGAPDPGRPLACLRACREALDLSPDVDCLNCADKARLQSARREVLLLMAEAQARLAGSDRLREALRLLDLAVEGEALSHGARLRRARYLELLGERETARRERALAEKIPPRDALDWFLRGQERWLAGDLRAALVDLGHAVDLEPELFWARLLLGVGLEKLGRNGDARTEFGLCIRCRRDCAWPYLLRAYLSVRSGQLDAAARDLNVAERLRLDDGARYALWLHSGVLALARGKPRQAAAEFQRAIFLSPRHPHGYANLTQAYWRDGDLARARAVLEHALRLAPDDVDLGETRVRLLLEQGDAARALDALDRVLALVARRPDARPSHPLLREKARLLYELRRYPEALPACREALRARPDDPVALRLHAEVLLELGQPREALEAFDAFLRHGKPDLDVYRRRARARAATGDLAGVADDCTLALELSREPSLYNARGWARLVIGSPREALRDFESALELAPGDAEALIGRGSARLELKSAKAAVADVEAGLKRKPAAPRVLYHAARTLARAAGASAPPSRELEKRAVEVLRQALRAVPAADRPRFFREQVGRDEAFRKLALRGDLRAVEAQLNLAPAR
jgi:tetratricopeptide (TPR) repeat protein